MTAHRKQWLKELGTAAGLSTIAVLVMLWAGQARGEEVTGLSWPTPSYAIASHHVVGVNKMVRGHRRRHQPTDSNGNIISRSGVRVRVAPAARAALQCVVDYVEGAGVKVVAMRGYGPGTVRGSLHPSGKALDINQFSRNVTHPAVPRTVANAAADHCGVVSGARWSYADNGHWNLPGRTAEPWPRTLHAEAQ